LHYYLFTEDLLNGTAWPGIARRYFGYERVVAEVIIMILGYPKWGLDGSLVHSSFPTLESRIPEELERLPSLCRALMVLSYLGKIMGMIRDDPTRFAVGSSMRILKL